MVNTTLLIQKYQELLNSNNATTADLERYHDLLINSYCYGNKSEAFKALLNHNIPTELEIVFADAYNITKEVVKFRSFLQPGINSVNLLESLTEDDLPFIITNLPDDIQMNLLLGIVENKYRHERFAEAVLNFCSPNCIERINKYRSTIDNIPLLSKIYKKVSFLGQASNQSEFKTLRKTLRGKKNITIVVENQNGFSLGCYINNLPTLIKKTMKSNCSVLSLKGTCGKIEENTIKQTGIITLNNGKLELKNCFKIEPKEDHLTFTYNGHFEDSFNDVSTFGYSQFGFGLEGAEVPCIVKCYSTY
ncbi:hypothetical protein EHI8A_022450 [Entamoeba histolytica HM-1:IMSS-B]|uniref:Uncharacterized protein n=6 Tax=Entamoeba histolytica TaxID=5759 RepID=C4M628_ENTH1|nr:hypothetical protein EHI_125380 [Entamoeba histolytica HM-1:IMSS]EMD45778.1 Hypothetical protein EHI5A_037990 [Entamoeba histolytica KU27]EMH78006.1 hypothetical protein EHI8A_022450 [Entamoeba histolytica HM-1:IMSS-B]EMS16986.1 hypothetical protein KM1_056440 [Entamoeba histolytica HM-3:IMSS]ENY62322.1 hypothetical protein EHI7A_024940 [Entamoeba histolytica HM-1:IMSS-A]GAT96909.1 hypothetical protein CL6EHI_125380 [Entamoeba histolytica]|eukprot:XP_653746.1 hypothetical protein EHI_125380 [Entamoeba histolytica HM-1:IMSS]